jgi:hypothetical protein
LFSEAVELLICEIKLLSNTLKLFLYPKLVFHCQSPLWLGFMAGVVCGSPTLGAMPILCAGSATRMVGGAVHTTRLRVVEPYAALISPGSANKKPLREWLFLTAARTEI